MTALVGDKIVGNAMQLFCFGKARPSYPVAWWQSIWLWMALAIGSLLPFFVSPLPPLGDLYTHISRYHVMLNGDQSPFLHRYYAFEWQLVPNTGQDLIVFAVGQWLGAEKGALFASALIPPAMILLIRQASIAYHGAVQPTAILATPFVYTYTYQGGFMNFHTGLILTLLTVVLWPKIRPLPLPVRIGLLASASAIVWVAHIAAWAILVVIVLAVEAVGLFRRAGFSPTVIVRDGLPTALAVCAPFALNVFKAPSHTAAPYIFPLDMTIWMKQQFLLYPLRDQIAVIDMASLAIIAAIPMLLLLRSRLKVEAGLALAALTFFVLFLVIPTNVMNGFYADMRLLPMFWMLGLIALRPNLSRGLAILLVVGGLSIFSGRMALTSYGWSERGTALQQELAALNYIPKGARIAQASTDRDCDAWENTSISHLASFAVFRRDAFVNTQWIIPGATQLIKPVYLEGSPYNAWQQLNLGNCYGESPDAWLDHLPRDRFDFVWLFREPAAASKRDWLVPVYVGAQSTLYRIARD